jgi:hypothetical protein
MTTQKELLQAAQIAAAKASNGDSIHTHDAKSAAFKETGAPEENWPQFSQWFDQNLSNYEMLEKKPLVKPIPAT